MHGRPNPGKMEHLVPSPRYGFDGKVALITDGTQGVRRSVALSLAARGAVPVISYDSDDEGAVSTVAAIKGQGVSTTSIHADLEDPDDIDEMFRVVEERFGRLDFFISSTTVSSFQPLMDLEPDDLERNFNVSVRALVLGAQRAARLMNRCGRIVVLSSFGSRYALPMGAAVGSMHAAADQWARQIAVELAPSGINVNVLMLGLIEADPTSRMFVAGLTAPPETVGRRIPKQRLGFVQEVADCALFLLSPASEYITGATLVVDGGLTAADSVRHGG